MHPYRDIPARVPRPPRPPVEEFAMYVLLLAIGAIPVTIALIERMAFGREATIGLLMIGAGLWGLFCTRRRARRDRRQ